jgi:hypothetical protein
MKSQIRLLLLFSVFCLCFIALSAETNPKSLDYQDVGMSDQFTIEVNLQVAEIEVSKERQEIKQDLELEIQNISTTNYEEASFYFLDSDLGGYKSPDIKPVTIKTTNYLELKTELNLMRTRLEVTKVFEKKAIGLFLLKDYTTNFLYTLNEKSYLKTELSVPLKFLEDPHIQLG